MKKRMITWVLAALCLLTLTPGAAYAALDATPSNLTVVMSYGDTPLEGIHVAVCPVANVKEVSGGLVFSSAPAFADIGANFDNLTTEKNIALAASFDAYASAHHISRSARVTDANGKALYTGLAPGLYLVAQTEAAGSQYVIAPYLVMVPESIDTVDNRNYNVISYPKTEPVRRNVGAVSVSAYKVWKGTAAHPGSVTLQLYQNGSPYGSAVTLNDGNYWSYTWTSLNPGYTWTVDETNVPDGYAKAVTGSAAAGFVITNTQYEVPKTPAGPDTPKPPFDTPFTGDTANMLLWITTIVVSSIGLLAVIWVLAAKQLPHVFTRR